jgi:DegV family protein with EDD domain
MGAFEAVFAPLVEAGHQVLCLTITGGHSGTYSTASTSAQRFGDKVRVVDTLSLSVGEGFQVLAAARAALEGQDLDHVIRAAAAVRERSRLFILLDTIEFIHRGGRASALMPVLTRVTRMLRIKPILGLVEGRLSMHSLARSYDRGLAEIRQEIASLKALESLAVIHIRCPEIAEQMAKTLAEELGFPLKDTIIIETGPLLSVHGGPKAVGVVAVQKAS